MYIISVYIEMCPLFTLADNTFHDLKDHICSWFEKFNVVIKLPTKLVEFERCSGFGITTDEPQSVRETQHN